MATVHGISQPAFSGVLSQVLDALCRRMGQYIQFPQQEDLPVIKQDFYAIANFPHVIGAIDCTHIPLIPPSHNEHLYRNRKHTHSINVQVVCDAKQIITNVVAKYPGSSHDSFIFCNSSIHRKLSNGVDEESLLLGESLNVLFMFKLFCRL